jgi:hypothetical protein
MFNTLGQTGTININGKAGNIATRAGSAITDEKAKQRGVKAKLISQTVMARLINIAIERGAIDQANAVLKRFRKRGDAEKTNQLHHK